MMLDCLVMASKAAEVEKADRKVFVC